MSIDRTKLLKILFVTPHLGHGGAEKVLVMLADYFSLKGHQVSIVLLPNDEPVIHEPNSSITLLHLNDKVKKSTNKILNMFRIVDGIKKSIKDDNPDIVISFQTGTNVLASIASKLAKKPIIISEHSAYLYGPQGKLWFYLRRAAYPQADALVLLTDEDMPHYHFVENKYKIVNPLLLQDNHKDIKREKIILAVGRLDPVKGFDTLIRTFGDISEKNQWKVMIMGEGEERKNLENLIEDLHLQEKVILLGAKEDVEIYYKRASIFVLSSRFEGFPGALCEAMGYGCASISFDCKTGPKEIIDDSNGILVKDQDSKALLGAIEDLMNDSDRRDALSRNAIAIRKRLNIDNIANSWLELALKTIDKR